MPKPELVLSNTTTFFGGDIEALFKKAKKYGFKFLEIVPYRWSRPNQIREFSRKYNIEIAGIHLPEWWNKSILELLKERPGLEKLFGLLWQFYIGGGRTSPALALAQTLQNQNPSPYVLLHSDLAYEMGGKLLAKIAQEFHVVIENIPYHKKAPQFLWDPITIQKKNNLAFDPGHYLQSIEQLPQFDLLKTYRQIHPEVIHISYNNPPVFHSLPNEKEQEELTQMLRIHQPKYVVLETNPWVSVAKGKKLLEKIIEETVIASPAKRDEAISKTTGLPLRPLMSGRIAMTPRQCESLPPTI